MILGEFYFLTARWLIDVGHFNGWNLYLRAWPHPRAMLILRPGRWQLAFGLLRFAYVARLVEERINEHGFPEERLIMVWQRRKATL